MDATVITVSDYLESVAHWLAELESKPEDFWTESRIKELRHVDSSLDDLCNME